RPRRRAADLLAHRCTGGQGLGVRELDPAGLPRLLQRLLPERDPRLSLHHGFWDQRALQGADPDPAVRPHAGPQGELLTCLAGHLPFPSSSPSACPHVIRLPKIRSSPSARWRRRTGRRSRGPSRFFGEAVETCSARTRPPALPTRLNRSRSSSPSPSFSPQTTAAGCGSSPASTPPSTRNTGP